MNARWFRDNIMVLVAVVIFTGILAGSVYFLRQAMADQETVQQELESQHQSLSGLQEQKPFPSRENLTVIKDDMEQIKRLYAAIQNAALREPIAPEEVAKAIDFTQLILSTRDQLTAEAEKNNVRVPEAFAWSFSRYVATFPCKTPAASAAECQQLLQLLSKQLAIVKRLSRLLIDSRVESIGAIRRTEVEPGGSTDSLNLPIDDTTGRPSPRTASPAPGRRPPRSCRCCASAQVATAGRLLLNGH